jgi:hypothetical protein
VRVEDDLNGWGEVIAAMLVAPDELRRLGARGHASLQGPLSWAEIGIGLLRAARSWTASPAPRPRPAFPRGPGMVSEPRWLREHRRHDALGSPSSTRPGQPRWLAAPQWRPEPPAGQAWR